jgi:hypothetical protein
MTNCTNTVSKLTVALGMIAMLEIGGVKPSWADSNDGGIFNKALTSVQSVWPCAPDYAQSTGFRRAMRMKQKFTYPVPNANESPGFHSGTIPPRGGQG